MISAEKRFSADPVIMGALAARNLDVTALPWKRMESASGEEVHVSDRLQPSIQLSDEGDAIIRWWLPTGCVSYALDREGGILTIHDTTTPETMLDAMAGMTLNDVVEMPGAEGMRIVCAVNSRAFISDPLDTRIQVEPIPPACNYGETHEHHATA